jgi:hypothetical protein
MYLNPEIALERNQEFHVSMECKGCVHHSYLWTMRVCKLHTGLAGNNLAPCDDYREKKVSALEKANSLFSKSHKIQIEE